MKLKTLFASVTAVAAVTLVGVTAASAASTLEIVQERGFLRCQVGPPQPGFYNLDANGDGQVTKDELPKGRIRLFDRLLRGEDKNDDGQLSREEVEAGIMSRRPRRPLA